MREILFRGKRVDNGEWVCGDVHKNIEFTQAHIHPKGERLVSFKVIPETIGEYVEILDSYEGDLLYGCETDEYNCVNSAWVGEIKFNKECGRIKI